MPRNVGRGNGCLFALATGLCLWLALGGVMTGLSLAGVGIHDRVTADRPIRCGDDVMPDNDRYFCYGPGSPGSYEGLVKERRRKVERAPRLIVYGALLTVAGGLAYVPYRRASRRPWPRGSGRGRTPSRRPW